MTITAFSRGIAVLALAGMLAVAPARAQDAPREGAAVWSFLAGLPKDKRLEVLAREARREGRFTIYAALGIDRGGILIKLFNEKYPDVKVDFVRLTEPEVVDKVLLEHRTGRVNSDLALSSVPWMELLPEGLAPYEPTSWEDFDPRFRLGGVKDGWTAIVYELLPQTIAWRSDRVKKEEAPRTLQEMADPKWKGRAGSTTHLENFMNGLIGGMGEPAAMELIRKLAALQPRLYRSTAALAEGLAAGEFDICWDFSAHRPVLLKQKGAPVDFVFQDPLFGVGITFSVVKGAKNPYAAALFMDHLTQAAPLESLDKAEGGRFFGHKRGNFANKLADNPKLALYGPIPAARFKQLNRVAEDLFVRR